MKCKRKLIILIVVLCGSLALMGTIAVAAFQAPAVVWDVIGSGGGHLEQGNLSLDYTLGQPVVGQGSSGDTALCIGFWCGGTAERYLYLPLIMKGE
ncbi:MAG: hypothetical protein JXA21_02640 [Anaerolineae bacterium]|nr:hypothetical protein [Anaerolineae bacterium]